MRVMLIGVLGMPCAPMRGPKFTKILPIGPSARNSAKVGFFGLALMEHLFWRTFVRYSRFWDSGGDFVEIAFLA